MLSRLRNAWKRLPAGFQSRVYRALRPTGLPYLLSFLAKYSAESRSVNFAGEWSALKAEYRPAGPEERKAISRRFVEIADAIVLPNGVRKTTYPARHDPILRIVGEDPQFAIERDTLRVLEVPSSIGLTSLDVHESLSKRYRIEKYVLADLAWDVLIDPERGCVFDEAGNLLQVRHGRRFFSVYRPQVSGNLYGVAASSLLAPLNLVSSYFKKKYRASESRRLDRVALVHPDVEARIGPNGFSLEKMDVFSEVRGEFDLILSFNLLQKNYFPEERIQEGFANLTGALSEGGLLVMGNTESFAVWRKVQGRPTLLHRSGDF